MADKDDLVSFWKMDEASGNLLDAFASNDLTQNGTVASASGKISTARGPFSASNYFSSTSANLQKGSGDFSFACWATNATSSFPVIVSKGWPGGEYVIYANGGDVVFAIGPSGSVVESGIISGWNFIVAVYDSTVPRLRLSLNGGTFVNATVSPINSDSGAAFVIGCSPAQSIFWNTSIDEFAFWKGRALTQSDVTRFYNSGSGLDFASWTGGSTGTTVTLGVASLSITRYIPTILTPQTVTPPTTAVSTTSFAPTVLTPQTVTPPTRSLTLTSFAPVVTATANQVATPTTATLTTNRLAPTVSVSSANNVTPLTATLTLATFAPTVTTTANLVATPATASLSLSAFAPTVNVANASVTVTPLTASLTLATFAPSLSAAGSTWTITFTGSESCSGDLTAKITTGGLTTKQTTGDLTARQLENV